METQSFSNEISNFFKVDLPKVRTVSFTVIVDINGIGTIRRKVKNMQFINRIKKRKK